MPSANGIKRGLSALAAEGRDDCGGGDQDRAPGYRLMVYLANVEGRGYRQIAEMTGVSIGTVKSSLHRGRLAVPVLGACAVGLAATLFTGRVRPEAAEPRALHPEVPDQPSQAA